MSTDFEKLESDINVAMEAALREILSTPGKISEYSSKFDRRKEEGFYNSEPGPIGTGETPNWEPNPAYMDSLEEIWAPAEEVLNSQGLIIDVPLRIAFSKSREYKDSLNCHRRVFVGQILQEKDGKALTVFLLTVPHSHHLFEYVTSPTIYFSKTLPEAGSN